MTVEIPDFWTGVPQWAWVVVAVMGYVVAGLLTARVFYHRAWRPCERHCPGPDETSLYFAAGTVAPLWPAFAAGAFVWFLIIRPAGWLIQVGEK